MNTNFDWYAIRVKSKCEKMVSDQLRGKGYEEFLPMCWSRRLWSDRVKVIQMPLFTGYLFCRFDPDESLFHPHHAGGLHDCGQGPHASSRRYNSGREHSSCSGPGRALSLGLGSKWATRCASRSDRSAAWRARFCVTKGRPI